MKEVATVLACTLILAACGLSSGPTPNEAKATAAKPSQEAKETAAKPSQEAAAKVVDISIKDGDVTPRGKRVEVKVGQPVTLRVTSDGEDEIHVHSDPENEYGISPGPARDFTFRIDTPGQVAVESHHLEVTIVQLVVRP
ncbi:MAG: hypothetical protein ACXWDJ_11300 [Aeromicrobium sp.]